MLFLKGVRQNLPLNGSADAYGTWTWSYRAKNTLRNCKEMVLCCFLHTSYYEIVVISRIFLLLYILHDGELIAT